MSLGVNIAPFTRILMENTIESSFLLCFSEFWMLHCVRCGDEFECKYPAFTGISREIRCDLGEGDKARGGGSWWLGEYFHYNIILKLQA